MIEWNCERHGVKNPTSSDKVLSLETGETRSTATSMGEKRMEGWA